MPKNRKKAAMIVKAQEIKEKKEEKKIEKKTTKDEKKTEEEEVVEEVIKKISEETQKVTKKSAAQKRKERTARKAKRNKARNERRAKAASRSAARLAKIQAKSRGAGGASATAYESFKGNKGGSGDLAKTLSRSGGVSTKGTGVGRSGGGGIGVGTGGIEDLLGSGDFGDVTSVEGIDDFKVTPLVLKKGSKKSSRRMGDIKAAVEKKSKNLQKCIKRGRNKFKTLAGQVYYSFKIKKNGKVARVKVIKSSWNNKKYGKQVEKCLKKAVGSWKFSAVSKGDVTIEQMMIF